MFSYTNTDYDAIVVGSGPAGATLARELSRQKQKILVLEWGGDAPLKGSFAQMAGIAAIPGKSAFINSDLSLLIRGITTGGGTTINYATAMLPPFEMFDRYGIDLRPQAEQIKQILPYGPLPDDLIGPRAKRIWQGAKQAGVDWGKLDKLIDPNRCRANCHLCSYGCPYSAKWTARDFLDHALQNGCELLTHAKVSKVIVENGQATGVEYQHQGKICIARAPRIVLSAGGIGSAQILQSSGIEEAGKAFFIDPVVAVMGAVDERFDHGEVPMAAGVHLPEEGIILSDLALPKPFFHLFTTQVGRFHRLPSVNKTLTIMVKAKDLPGGRISSRWVNKTLAGEDKARLDKGVDIAKTILSAAGARHIYQTHHFAAHQGGSAAIGTVVNSDLETRIPNLYVCDASVIPEAWGLPPTFTLMCLAYRLSQRLCDS